MSVSLFAVKFKEEIFISIKHDMLLQHIESLEPGTRISVRELSAALGVSEGTAYKAVKDAEQRGLVTVRPKVGTIRVSTNNESLEHALSVQEVCRTLGLTVAAGKARFSGQLRHVIICDGSVSSVERQLADAEPDSCLCLCGDRPEMHEAVLRAGGDLLLTGGTKASWQLCSIAEQQGRLILTSPQSTYSLLHLLEQELGISRQSDIAHVGDWMQTPDYLYYNDIIADWERFYFDSHLAKHYPVVDEELAICGGLDIWRAMAALPSQKLRTVLNPEADITCYSIKDDIKDVARKFVINGDPLAAILDGDTLAGIVTANDLLRYYMYAGPRTYDFNADAFLVRDDTVSNDETTLYRVRIPDSELHNIAHIEMDLMLSAGKRHLRQLGCEDWKLDSGTFFAPKRIASVEGLLLVCTVRESGSHGYMIEVEINDDTVSYAKAVLIASNLKGA